MSTRPGVSSVQVDVPKPRWARTQSFLQLQAHWYRKLRERGFHDIETGRDTNQEKAYDPRNGGRRVSRLLHFMPNDTGAVDVEAMMAANAKTFGTQTNVADTPTAIAWRNISHAAHELTDDYRHRGFLVDVAQVGCIAAYLLRRHRLTWKVANWAFHRFLEDVGLDSYRGILVAGPSVAAPADVVEPGEAAVLALAARELMERGALSEADYHRYVWARGLEGT